MASFDEVANKLQNQYREHRSECAVKIRKQFLMMSRAKLAEKYAIAPSTVQSWETNMTEFGALYLCEVYKAEGLEVNIEWLMYGIGNPPPELVQLQPTKKKEQLLEEAKITKELQYFYQLSDKAVHCVIQDDALLPWLCIGDYVAGCWLFGDEIAQANNHICIVQLSTGQILVRVLKSASDGKYILMACNPSTTVDKPKQTTSIVSAAPVIWVRKPFNLGQF